jgi:hypothetical protein
MCVGPCAELALGPCWAQAWHKLGTRAIGSIMCDQPMYLQLLMLQASEEPSGRLTLPGMRKPERGPLQNLLVTMLQM